MQRLTKRSEEIGASAARMSRARSFVGSTQTISPRGPEVSVLSALLVGVVSEGSPRLCSGPANAFWGWPIAKATPAKTKPAKATLKIGAREGRRRGLNIGQSQARSSRLVGGDECIAFAILLRCHGSLRMIGSPVGSLCVRRQVGLLVDAHFFR